MRISKQQEKFNRLLTELVVKVGDMDDRAASDKNWGMGVIRDRLGFDTRYDPARVAIVEAVYSKAVSRMDKSMVLLRARARTILRDGDMSDDEISMVLGS